MNILIISFEFPPFAGGAGIYCLYLAKALRILNHSVTILTKSYHSETESVFDNDLLSHGIRVIRKKYSKIDFLLRWPSYIKKELHNSYQLVVLNTDSAQLLCSLPQIQKILPEYISIFHGKPNAFSLFNRRLLHKILFSKKNITKLYEKSKYRISVSESLKSFLIDTHSMNEVTVINNCIDTNQFFNTNKKNELKSKRSLSSNTKILITASRLIQEKSTDKIITILAELTKLFPDILLIIAGDGDYKSELVLLADSFGLYDNVLFTGKVPQAELRELYELSDLFILLSENESFGLVFIEANACGLPVIGNNVGGIPEAIENGKSGFLVDSNNSADVIEKISLLLTNNSLREEMGHYAQIRVEKKYSLYNLAEKYKELKLLQKS